MRTYCKIVTNVVNYNFACNTTAYFKGCEKQDRTRIIEVRLQVPKERDLAMKIFIEMLKRMGLGKGARGFKCRYEKGEGK